MAATIAGARKRSLSHATDQANSASNEGNETSDDDLLLSLRVLLFGLEARVGSLSPDSERSAVVTGALETAQQRIGTLLEHLPAQKERSVKFALTTKRGSVSDDIDFIFHSPLHHQSIGEIRRESSGPSHAQNVDGSVEAGQGPPSDDTTTGDGKRCIGKLEKFCQNIFWTLDNPAHNDVAFHWALLSLLLIVASILMIILESDVWFWRYPETCPEVEAFENLTHYNGVVIDDHMRAKLKCAPEAPVGFAFFEVACIIIFTVEYICRLLTAWSVSIEIHGEPGTPCPEAKQSAFNRTRTFVRHVSRHFCFVCVLELTRANCSPRTHSNQPLNLIDLLVIAPYFLEFIFKNLNSDGLGHLKVLRLSRIFRVLKMGKYNNGLRLIGRVIWNSQSALMLLVFFVSIGSVLCGSLMFYCERGEWSPIEGWCCYRPGIGFPHPFQLNTTTCSSLCDIVRCSCAACRSSPPPFPSLKNQAPG